MAARTPPLTYKDIDKLARSLPGVGVGARWGNRTWFANDKGFAWERPFSKADLARFGDEPPPAGEILAVIVENLDAKDALLAMDLPGFFTIPHFNGYAAVLIELGRARATDVRLAVRTAFEVAASALPARKKRRPAVSGAARTKRPRSGGPRRPAARSSRGARS